MTDEHPPSRRSPPRRWLERLSHFLTGEPQDLDDLREMLHEAQENRLLETDALAMIDGVLQIAQMRVRDVMIPRAQMVVVAQEAKLAAVLPRVVASGHSRYPVIEDDRSQVVGVLLIKDLLARALHDTNAPVSAIMRPAFMVPESKRLNMLLKELRTKGNHMAIVVDEYGQAAGLVTIEDILEQIVGDIEDEHDGHDDEHYIVSRGNGEYLVKALTPIDEFDDHFKTALAGDDYDTVGGFIVHRLEHMPEKGERLTVGPLRFEVLKADRRRVYLLKLKVSP